MWHSSAIEVTQSSLFHSPIYIEHTIVPHLKQVLCHFRPPASTSSAAKTDFSHLPHLATSGGLKGIVNSFCSEVDWNQLVIWSHRSVHLRLEQAEPKEDALQVNMARMVACTVALFSSWYVASAIHLAASISGRLATGLHGGCVAGTGSHTPDHTQAGRLLSSRL